MKKKKEIIIIILILLILCVIVYSCLNISNKKNANFNVNDINVPNIYINIESDIKEVYKGADIELDDGVKIETYEGVAIKLRGNMTKLHSKKPYTLKFSNKVNFFDMGLSKSWILIANAYDYTLMRNKIVFDFVSNLNMQYNTKVKYVNVYINGEYRGLYLLTHKLSIANEKLNIDVNNGDFFLEYEQRRFEEKNDYYVTNKNQWRFLIKNIDGFSPNQKKVLDKYFNKIEIAIQKKDYKKIKSLIDIDSMVDLYIMEEYFKDVDCFFSSLNFYFKNGKLYGGPIWDFDLSQGFEDNSSKHDEYFNRNNQGNNSNNSYEGIYCAKNIFGELLKIKQFKNQVRKRFMELQPKIKSIYKDTNDSKSYITKYYESYQKEYNKNICLWDKQACDKEKLRIEVEKLRKWLKIRNDWMIKNL